MSASQHGMAYIGMGHTCRERNEMSQQVGDGAHDRWGQMDLLELVC